MFTMKYRKQEIKTLEKARANLHKTSLDPIQKAKLFVDYSNRLDKINRCKKCNSKMELTGEFNAFHLYKCPNCDKELK